MATYRRVTGREPFCLAIGFNAVAGFAIENAWTAPGEQTYAIV
jgi:hypothetical protein